MPWPTVTVEIRQEYARSGSDRGMMLSDVEPTMMSTAPITIDGVTLCVPLITHPVIKEAVIPKINGMIRRVPDLVGVSRSVPWK